MDLHSSTPGATAPRTSNRLAELMRKLEFDIELARLPPGELISFATIARRIRCRPQDLPQVLAEAEQRGLLVRQTEACLIADVDRDRLPPLLARRRQLELLVVERAARRIAPLDEDELSDASVLMTRSALLGDIEGYMEAGRRLDHACSTAADLPEAGAEIRAIKMQFRRAWCAYNRLRDINEPAAIRREIADAVLTRRPDAAKDRVEAYFRYLDSAF